MCGSRLVFRINHVEFSEMFCFSSDRFGQKPPGMLDDYSMSSELLNKKVLTQQLPTEKRNVGSLARDFALPPGRRNIASLVREYEMQTRPNAESRDLPYTGK